MGRAAKPGETASGDARDRVSLWIVTTSLDLVHTIVTPEPRPLAAAALRLRGKPGRPRKGTGWAQSNDGSRVNGGVQGSGSDSQSGRPTALTERRLLDVAQAAAYLGGLGEDTVRELDASGVLTAARVVIPANKTGRPMRKVLFDRQALDRLVDGWRTPA